MSVAICGSMAVDNIMVFDGRFRDQIAADQVHILNVSFLTEKLHESFGGCAGNITYSLNLLGIKAIPVATVGKDFADYASWFQKHNISQAYLKVLPDTYTSRAFIVTDIDNNQIAMFHPGAMSRCHEIDIPKHNIALGLISPEGRDGMLLHAKQFMQQNVPYIFDPGQGIAMFNKQELRFFIEGATYLACNDYEFHVLCKSAELSLDDLKQQLDAIFVTRGSKGSVIHTQEETIELASVPPRRSVDPTGCGDAYRAGIIYGLLNKLELKTTGHIASLMGMLQVEHRGTQTYHFTLPELTALFEKHFSYPFPQWSQVAAIK